MTDAWCHYCPFCGKCNCDNIKDLHNLKFPIKESNTCPNCGYEGGHIYKSIGGTYNARIAGRSASYKRLCCVCPQCDHEWVLSLEIDRHCTSCDTEYRISARNVHGNSTASLFRRQS